MSLLSRSRAATIAVVLATTAVVSGQSERPLPSVEVVTAAGVRSPLPALAIEGRWLLVSIAPSSPPSSRLLEALSQWDLGERSSRLLIVVAGTADARPSMQIWAERLPGSRWVADPNNDVPRSLNLRGAPMVLGVRGREIAWTLAGVLNDPSMVRDVATSWLLANP